ncbi:hydrolase, metallo-beta-lactamase superfamily [Thermococcus kodakarensis KOD1]|uniref:Hydrolase, metallo-beta-lactamase superfamily n=1 Tax=Thermococcus kodakarensis (strain ATCC BAA-918 / JCM 12380 / KOD1) TaxID=69014 RepID=Q5JHR1_THEKO|nr:MBL fold metallo-hydrolase [Thermococcus kodakarensis]WCN28064.1 MBL fold metallo-hydrolase [Thermococcus kodakarensis]WCN30361.1 MBL fold metallo-hydrolase [Thermococcus kodakarensis]BAD86421.1 hydrolase, metallo-beta-lactamase superfamily [Thermococcus kodakarensis KOD1]
MKIIWYGHSCFWIETKGVKFLIDPYPEVDDDRIGDVDYILITHEHTDHYGKVELLSRLRDATVIGPKQVYLMAVADGVTKAREIDAGETIELENGVKVTAIYVEHPSSQYPLGYIIEGDKTVFHPGDTYSTPAFQRLRGKIDVLLVPISGRSTANEREAAQIIEDIRPKVVIPMHYGVYNDEDPSKLESELRKRRIWVRFIKPELYREIEV